MNLTIRQLDTFREVMRSNSISEAARALNRTQPAISAMISGLEKELEFALFIREHARLTPTPEAYFFLEEVEDVLGRLDRSQRTLKEISSLKKGTVRIACLPAASSFFMPSVVSEFARTRPKVKISLMMRSSIVVDELIASQKFDIGLAEKPPLRNAVDFTDFDLECLCAIPENDPLANSEVITPERLNGASLAMLYDAHTTSDQTRRHFQEAGKKFIKRFELQTFLPALQLVESGLCYCICDMVTAYSYIRYRKHSSGIKFRPFRPIVSSPVSLLTPAHRPQSQLTRAFSSLLIEKINKMIDTMTATDIPSSR